ncbi:methyltransferase domain-containing protein [Leptolyngbya sp. FACHB-541]|uniref:class I SAM-dependent methyltransferase n=1 Tax=Leptolyngbya sp. FACHB-541 TaxID=2692810 RepID=UPI0016897C8B|nr:class I SAM-dependent methyltransferase [Leptolyngbya sp. FACHB-541]MBD2001308.1 methyltransferase domain-containing protein [Leptolyngbya sp. FACHB-541]
MTTANSVHAAARQGFQIGADAYERGRPGYPAAAIEFLQQTLNLSSATTVVDLAAGTGKFTRQLQDLGCQVVAIEPVEGMRQKFEALLPNIPVLNGTAESIPLDAASTDVVTVAQAFHWFQGEAALAEIHRVLKPGGYLGLIWNVRDESVDWVAQISAIITPHEGDAPRYRTGQWRTAFEQTDLFTPLETQIFSYAHQYDLDAAIDRVASISFIAALNAQTQQTVLRQVRELLEHHPQTRDRPIIEHPYRTEVFWCTRKS